MKAKSKKKILKKQTKAKGKRQSDTQIFNHPRKDAHD